MKPIKKIVFYYTDGTYEEVDVEKHEKSEEPKDDAYKIRPWVKRADPFDKPSTQPGPYEYVPGDIGKWDFPPPGIGTLVVD